VGTLRTDAAPGAWLRLVAIAAAASSLLAVVTGAQGTGTTHRVVAALALPPLAALLVSGAVSHRRLLPAAIAAVALFLAAAAATTEAAHLTLAALALATTSGLVVLTLRGRSLPRGDLSDYLSLTKPRIMSLLLLTGACGMIVGARGMPPPGLFVLTLLGLALACGGASALNHVLDRDLDRLMGPRTAGRPVAAGRVSAPHALEFGLALSAASFTLLASTVNVLTAVLALAGNLFYVVVYTGYLKRHGPTNIVIGGAAGAVPPVVGYAAATGSLALPALWLFLIVFLWTPPHFWALALLLREHYAAARVPMLPVVAGERATSARIVVYTIALVAFTAVPVATGSFGVLYLVAAAALGAVFLALVFRLRRTGGRGEAALAFHYSLAYLALLFVAAAADAAL
jgi:protoheme IX farnesyltransferase